MQALTYSDGRPRIFIRQTPKIVSSQYWGIGTLLHDDNHADNKINRFESDSRKAQVAQALLYIQEEGEASEGGITVKRIEAIIRPGKVSDVCEALDKTGHSGVTISAVEGRGKQKGWVNQIRGSSYKVNLLTKARLEVIAKDEDVDDIVKTIRDAALTGEVGDGKIFIHDMANVIRIRTNESGMAAL